MVGIPVIPDGLRLEFEMLAYRAQGVQIYQCTPAGTWTFQAPRASLYDDADRLVAEHFAGPTWQAADGSTVTGRKIAEAAPEPDAIPWLLLEAASNTGDGTFGKVKYIQRLATTGGRAPDDPCQHPSLVEVPYTAVYVFHTLRQKE